MPEVKAWKNLINIDALPINKEEEERLKKYEEKKVDRKDNKGIEVRAAIVEKIASNGGGGFGSTFNVAQGVELKRK